MITKHAFGRKINNFTLNNRVMEVDFRSFRHILDRFTKKKIMLTD